MKNIVELTEKYLAEIDNADGIEELEQKAEESKIKLQEALSEYKRLCETPITEDWLKVSGFEVHEGLRGLIPAPYANRLIGKDYLEYDTGRKSLKIFSDYEEGDGVYSNFYCENIDTVAQLYDACEICGIKID